MTSYIIIIIVLFLIVVVFYSFLVNKNRKNVEQISEQINNASEQYFLLMAHFEKILKNKDEDEKKKQLLDLKGKVDEYLGQYSSPARYVVLVKKLQKKINDILVEK